MFDYTKLRKDVAKAMSKGLQETACLADDGTCNFDSVYLFIDDCDTEKAKHILENCGFPWCEFINSNLVELFRVVGQAHRQTVFAETVVQSLQSCGWQAYVHYCMD